MNKSLILISFVVGLSFLLVGGANTSQNVDLSPSNNQPVSININSSASPTSTSSGSQDLQLQTFNSVSTPPPVQATGGSNPVVPGNPCPVDTGQAMSSTCSCSNDARVTCSGGSCVGITGAGYNSCADSSNPPCGTAEAPGTGTYCWLKPVIYLYPTSSMTVSVKIDTVGKITISDPLYQDGWDNILAYPDGKLIYKDEQYKELFYETSVNETKRINQGKIVQTQDIEKELYDLTGQLGLVKKEQDELVSFWVPRLKNLNKKYILISLVDKQSKEAADRVIISPKPDTEIEIIFYFKGLDTWQDIPPFSLPQAPQRVGFTSVEWGGTIDYQ